MSDRYVPLHRTPRPNQPTSAEAEAEAIARLRPVLLPDAPLVVVRQADLRALLDAHAALEAAHTMDAGRVTVDVDTAFLVRRVFLPQNPNKLRSCSPEVVEAAKRFISAVEAVLAKAGRR